MGHDFFVLLDFQQRRILGHHVDAGLASPLTYGRDNLTPLQARLRRMLDKIARGVCDPDLPRVQRLDIDVALQQTCDDLDEDHETVVYGPSAEHVVDVDELPLPAELEEQVAESQGEDKVYILATSADGRIMQHRISGVLHFVGIEDRFACGRPISNFYETLSDDLAHQWPVCQQCRRIIGEETLGTYIEP